MDNQILRVVVRSLSAARRLIKRIPQAAASQMTAFLTGIFNVAVRYGLAAKSHYRVECRDRFGNLKWVEDVPNLVVNAGLNDLLDKYFKGSSYTAAWYIGLKGAGTIAAGDTLASHAGWSEITDYSGDRKAATFGTVSGQSLSNSGSPASFSITGTATVAGAFLCTAATGTSGVLYGVANFSSSRSTESGDTLNVTCTTTAADAG